LLILEERFFQDEKLDVEGVLFYYRNFVYTFLESVGNEVIKMNNYLI